MKVQASELTGPALDWAVAKCEEKGGDCEIHAGNVLYGRVTSGFVHYRPSANWAQGGPIIERERIKVAPNLGGTWLAQLRHTMLHPLATHPVVSGWTSTHGTTPLTAAMRCYVEFQLGKEVEVPDELMENACMN